MFSNNWKEWHAQLSTTTCTQCRAKHGKLFELNEYIYPYPPLHPNCKCVIQRIQSIIAGFATYNGLEGADWYLKNTGNLPNYYISKKLAKQLGWVASEGNLSDIAPGCMLCKGIYKNRNRKLPSKLGRLWYEADINYTIGQRNAHRILFSNDGLIFVTYDHYNTFMEIV